MTIKKWAAIDSSIEALSGCLNDAIAKQAGLKFLSRNMDILRIYDGNVFIVIKLISHMTLFLIYLARASIH